MIYFLVNIYGVSPSTTLYPPQTLNLDSSFAVYDTNVPFTIATIDAEIDISTKSWQDTASQLAAKLGEDYYTLYAVAHDTAGGYGSQNIVGQVLPSMKLAYPRVWSRVDDNPNTGPSYWAYHFVSLDRILLVCTSYSAFGPYVYTRDSPTSRTFTWQNNPTSSAPSIYDNTTYKYLCLKGYKKGVTDLRDPLNYYNLSVGETIAKRIEVGEGTGGANRFLLTTLFGKQDSGTGQWTTVEPDGEGTQPLPDNPYEPGGDSGEGAEPPGTFDDTSDPIPDSSLPTISSAATGFTRIYNPTLSQLNSLAQYMWTDDSFFQTFWNHIKQYIEDPMQAIIGLNIVPVPVPNGGTEEVKVLYIPTGVQMTKAASQFVDRDCGTVKLERYYGSALDQSPYTTVECFLPFVGTVHLDTDEVMGAELNIKYRIDVCSGECVAKIFVDGNCLYQYAGNCAINVPISSANFSNYIGAVLGLAGAVAGGFAGGGIGAVAGLMGSNPQQQTGATITTVSDVIKTERNPDTGRQVKAGTTHRVTTQTKEQPVTKASFSGLVAENINNTVGQVMTSKERIERSGGFSGTSGYLGVRRPYLVVKRPNMCMPSNYQKFNGFPCMITMQIGDCSGFTQVQQVQLTGMTATNPEQAEILELLKSGVIM